MCARPARGLLLKHKLHKNLDCHTLKVIAVFSEMFPLCASFCVLTNLNLIGSALA
jgi:hypothetical protein